MVRTQTGDSRLTENAHTTAPISSPVSSPSSQRKYQGGFGECVKCKSDVSWSGHNTFRRPRSCFMRRRQLLVFPSVKSILRGFYTCSDIFQLNPFLLSNEIPMSSNSNIQTGQLSFISGLFCDPDGIDGCGRYTRTPLVPGLL